jgi:phage terminase large subunit GpA-like protein
MKLFTLESLVVEAAAAARPPERLTVSQAAEKYRQLNNPGSYVGPWRNDKVPYLVEPMDVLTSTSFLAMCFAGPAQCGKTDMALNWIGYSAKCDPADMMIVQTSNITARDFSIRRLDRLHRHSPMLGACLLPGKSADNTFDKHYAGMLLTLAWPSINELSGKPIPRQWVTDYDRIPEDVDGEGSAFDLTRKRGTSFGRFAMTAVESSPGFIVENPKWQRKSRHEAPPTKGILAVYNRGDRRRWYWDCIVCHEKFEPAFDLLKWVDSQDIMEAAESVWMECPHCQQRYWHDPHDGMPGKYDMNLRARWVKDGQAWNRSGDIVGTAYRSDIASFWLKGPAAAFSTWQGMVFNYLSAEQEYDRTGAEEALKSTINVDQGEPYLPKAMANDRVPEEIKSRAVNRRERMVPNGVRFLLASVDVQKNRFVVQVHGVDDMQDIHVIDRFEIKKSKRIDEDGDTMWVNPGAYLEDWKLLAEQVIQKSYPLDDDSGRNMQIKLTVCDSGGKAGVTANAYQFFRWLRFGPTEAEVAETSPEQGSYDWEPGMAARFALIKGASTANHPRVAVSYPDSQRKDRDAGARGEIPVWMVNTNTLKDMVDNKLDRKERGGRLVFPSWLPDTFYTELTVEVKDAKKGWINPRGYRNESWDLLAYCMAATLMPMIGLEHLDMAEPPGWAAEWDQNGLVFNPAKTISFKPQKKRVDLAKLASDLA